MVQLVLGDEDGAMLTEELATAPQNRVALLDVTDSVPDTALAQEFLPNFRSTDVPGVPREDVMVSAGETSGENFVTARDTMSGVPASVVVSAASAAVLSRAAAPDVHVARHRQEMEDMLFRWAEEDTPVSMSIILRAFETEEDSD